MIDYITAILYQCKYRPNFNYCKLEAYFSSGWERYSLEGCTKIDVYWNENLQQLKISGSLPYFIKGHNFTFTTEEFCNAIDLIDSLLGNIGLWDACVTSFEYGVIVPVSMKPKEYIQNHNARKGSKLHMGEKEKDNGSCRFWNGDKDSVVLKMYDAVKNLKQKQSRPGIQKIIEEGYDPQKNYLKFEVHYNKAEALCNGYSFRLEYLQNDDWIAKLKEQLILQYNRLMPSKALILPDNKKDLSTTDIVLQAFANTMINTEGMSLEMIKKTIYTLINKIPETTLTKSDKNARKNTLRKSFKRLVEADTSPYDLNENLMEGINKEM